MRYVILPLLYIGLTAYCFIDALQHEDREPYGLHKFVWMAVIILIPYVGAAAWIIIKISKSRGGGSVDQRPIAPDDDPDYLLWLREQDRRRKREGR